jgi:hypothetical protein
LSEDIYLRKVSVFINQVKLLLNKGKLKEAIQMAEDYEFGKGK